MPNYEDILRFLAKNPPQLSSERQLHASILELLAACLRNQEQQQIIPDDKPNKSTLFQHMI